MLSLHECEGICRCVSISTHQTSCYIFIWTEFLSNGAELLRGVFENRNHTDREWTNDRTLSLSTTKKESKIIFVRRISAGLTGSQFSIAIDCRLLRATPPPAPAPETKCISVLSTIFSVFCAALIWIDCMCVCWFSLNRSNHFHFGFPNQLCAVNLMVLDFCTLCWRGMWMG